MQNWGILLYFFLLVAGQVTPLKAQETRAFENVSLFHVDSAITPATFEYLSQGFSEAPQDSLLVIKMNTPGGLISTTKEIMTLIGNEKRTTVIWVTPQGASAASAGAIIASSARYIFMSPGTTIGAATPVGLGGDITEQDGKKKILNDLLALVRSFNALNDRNNLPFEKMILSASSFTEKEALKEKIITAVISDEKELLIALNSPDATIMDFPLSFGQKILEILSHPTTAYILFLAGLALVYLEFQAPGGYVAGSIGSVLLILAAMAFQVLPLHWGFFGLIILGLVLFVMEMHITSYGILFILGFASFMLGSLFLFHGEMGFISIQHTVLLSTAAGVLVSLALVSYYLLRESRRFQRHDLFSLVGLEGFVLTKHASGYQVKVHGEIWNAVSEEELSPSDQIRVTEYDPAKLILKITSQRR